MFVCAQCLKKNYTNEPNFFQSRGPCEDCGKVRDCSDIPSFALNPKPKRKKKQKALSEAERAERFRKAAREQYAAEGEIEIDDGAEVSETTCIGVGEGAYVQAWVWVSDEAAGLEDKG